MEFQIAVPDRLDRFNDGKRSEERDRVKHRCTCGCGVCEGE